VVGAASLAVMAHRADEVLGRARAGRLLAVAVDARRGMLYLQLFGAAGETMSAPMLVTAGDFPAHGDGQPLLAVGSGAAVLVRALTAQGRPAEAALADLEPHAASLAALAPDLAPSSAIEPLYLRRPDVKPQAPSLARAVP
jgi:tRNA A37 threonylcarbamoyladenosine modification protein TsaB